MLRKLHGFSLVIGIALGAGLMFLGGATGSNPSSSGRFQLVTSHTNDQMSAYVVDTQTGQAVMLLNGGATPIVDPWKDQK
jgi:hypothetical protein